MSAHTPGPWRYDMAGCETSHRLPSVLKANGHQLAHLCEHSEANARLIAAAPDLLEALRQIETHHIEINHNAHRSEHDSWTLRTVRAAIAKAEGTS